MLIKIEENKAKIWLFLQKIPTGIYIYLFIVCFFLGYSSFLLELPGLYMDSINPEYMIPEILYQKAPVFPKWLLPGNVINNRFPVFSGPVYHGSIQIYATLPFLFLFGSSLLNYRIFQILIMLLIIILVMILVQVLNQDSINTYGQIFIVGLLIATDPIIAFGIRTQAYSILFHLPLFLGSWLLLKKALAASEFSLKSGILVFLSGLLLGLSVFGYFVYVFFVPWLIYLFFKNSKNRLINVFLWGLGILVGLLPFFFGVFLIVKSVGGIPPALEWWKAMSSGLNVIVEDQGVFVRLKSITSYFYQVLSSKWLFLTVFKESPSYHYLGVSKVVLVLFILFFVGWRKNAKLKIQLILIVVVYMVVALFLGNRLSGHHLTLLVPFVYMGVVVSLPFLSRKEKGMYYLGWIPVLSLLFFNFFIGVSFLTRLKDTGGVGLYSDAINRFANEISVRYPDSTVYFPDWGYRMPFTFLTNGKVEYDSRIDPLKIRQDACLGKDSYVVFDKINNEKRFDLIERNSGLDAEVTTWYQYDEKPVFQVGYFSSNQSCDVDTLQTVEINVFPPIAYTCSFLSTYSMRYVEWDFSQYSGVDQVRIYVSSSNNPEERTLWTKESAVGGKYTGAWVRGNTLFTFVDDNAGGFLGEFLVDKVSCPLEEFENNGSWAKPR